MKEVILRFLFSFYCIHLLTFQATVLTAEKKKDELEKILANRREELIGTKDNKKNSLIQKKVDDVSSQAQIHWTTMEKLLWRTFLWKDLSNPDNNNLIENFKRLKIIAQGFSTPGSKLERNKKVRDDLIFALEWIYKSRYNEEKIKQEKQMRAEAAALFSDILVLIKGALSDAQFTKFSKAILFHSQISAVENTTEINPFLNSALLVAALAKNSSKVDSILMKVNTHLSYTSGGTGFYEDGSYLSDKVEGIKESVDFLTAIANTFSLINNTKFQFDKSKREILETWINKGFIPQVFDNSFIHPKSASTSNHRQTYLKFLETVVKLSAFGKEDIVENGTIKYLLQLLPSDEVLNFDYKTLATSQKIISDKSILPKPLPANLTVYNNFKKITARRPDFFFGLSLFSFDKSQIARVSDLGETLIVNKNQSTGLAASKVDSLRVPGTTILPLANKSGKSQGSLDGNFVGGAELDRLYAVVGMEVSNENSLLKYKKSWFVFDNEIVALGAGINTKTNDQTESVIDQISFNSDVLRIYEGMDSIYLEDWGEVLKPNQFIYIQNATDSLGRGYYFPLFQDVSTKISKLNDQSSLSFSIVHSKKNMDSHYQYVLLPAISKDSMIKYDSNPDVIVLGNNDKLQAVKEKSLNIIGANFWTKSASELSVDGSFLITCNAQASLICIEKEGIFELSVSDPTKANERIIQIELVNKPLGEIIAKDERIEVIDIEGSKRILINVKNAQGASIKVKFKLPEPEVEN